MKYITVLDFEMERVFQYKLDKFIDTNHHFHGDYEEYLTNKGHNLQNCEWMVHKVAGIIKSKFWNSVI